MILHIRDRIKKNITDKDVIKYTKEWKNKLSTNQLKLVDKCLSYYMKSYPKKQLIEDISKFKGDLIQVIVFLHTFKDLM